MADVLKHHLPAHNELDGTVQVACTRGCQSALRPGPEFASEPGTKKPRDDLYLLRRNTQHLRKHVTMVDDSLRGLIKSELLAVVDSNRRMELDWIVRLDGGRINL